MSQIEKEIQRILLGVVVSFFSPVEYSPRLPVPVGWILILAYVGYRLWRKWEENLVTIKTLQLFAATSANDVETIRALITAKAPINAIDKQGHSAIQLAIQRDLVGTAKILIEAGARVDEAPGWMCDAMFAAVNHGNTDMLRLLIELKVDVTLKGAEEQTPVEVAVSKGHTSCLQVLVNAGARVDAQDKNVCRAVREAVAKGDTDLFASLLLAKASVEAAVADENALLSAKAEQYVRFEEKGTDYNPQEGKPAPAPVVTPSKVVDSLTPAQKALSTLLNKAVKGDSHPPAEYSVAKSAKSSNNVTKQKIRPSLKSGFKAIATNDTVAMRSLLSSNISLEEVSPSGQTLLQVAITSNRAEMAAMLVDAGATVNASAAWVTKEMFRTAGTGFTEMLNVLIDAKADVNVTSSNGKTPLSSALMFGRVDCAQTLLDVGAQFDPNSSFVREAVCNAAMDGNVDMLRLLVEENASVNVRDNHGVTALQLAKDKKRAVAIDYLTEVLNTTPPNTTSLSKIGAQLFNAIFRSDIPTLQRLIDHKANLNVVNRRGQTPLRFAAARDTADAARVLVAAGARVNPSDPWVVSTIYRFVGKGEVDKLNVLIDANADVNMVTGNGKSPLYCAMMSGFSECAEALIRAGAHLDTSSFYVHQAMHSAAVKGDVDMLRLLVSVNASTTQVDSSGWTPLMRAIRHGKHAAVKYLTEVDSSSQLSHVAAATHSPVTASSSHSHPNSDSILSAVSNGDMAAVKRLISARADIDQTDNEGRTPLLLSIEDQRTDIARVLIYAGANLSVSDKAGRSPLSLAAMMGLANILKTLIDTKAVINAVNGLNQSALHLACQNSHAPVVQLLLNARADPDICVANVGTAVSVAAVRGDVSVLKMLIKADAAIDVPNSRGRTPLHIAAQFGHTAAVQLLIDAGAVVDARDVDGLTPFTIALSNGKRDVLKLLMAAEKA